MNELSLVEDLENVSLGVHVLLLELLAFALKGAPKRGIGIEKQHKLGFNKSDEEILGKLNETEQKITEIIETKMQDLNNIYDSAETKLFEDNKNLTSRLNELKQKLTDSIGKNEELTSAMTRDINKLIARNDELREDSHLQTELSKCKLNLENATLQLDRFIKPNARIPLNDHVECEKHKDLNQTNRNKVESLKGKVENLLAKLSYIEENLQSTKSQTNELSKLVQIFEDEKKELNNHVATLLNNLTSVQEKLEFARKQNPNYNELVKLCNSEKGEIERELILKLKTTREELSNAKAKSDELKELLVSYENDKEELENKLKYTISNLTYFQDKLEAAENHTDELNEKIKLYDNGKQELENQVVSLRSNLTKTQQELETMKSKYENLSKENKNCSKMADYLDNKLANVFNKLARTEKELQYVKEKDEKLHETLKSCENKRKGHRNEMEKLKGNVKACENEKVTLLKICANEKKTIENNLKSVISKTEQQLQDNNRETEKQKRIIKSCEAKNNEIVKQLTSVTADLKKKQEEFRVLNYGWEEKKKILNTVTPDVTPKLMKSGNLNEPFYILSKKEFLAVGVESTSHIKVTTGKERHYSGQMWVYKDRMLYNKLNGNVLTLLSSGKLTLDKPTKSSNQLWDFREDGTVVSGTNQALDIIEGRFEPGIEVIGYVVHGLQHQVFFIKFV